MPFIGKILTMISIFRQTKNVLRLIRWPNLLISGLTMYLLRYTIFMPLADNAEISLPLERTPFMLLVFGLVCITAAGYVINDYFDRETDAINKPEKVILGLSISIPQGISLYIILNIAGIVAGYFAARACGYPKLVFIFVLAATLLWFYSSNYKRKFLTGNLVVAFLSAMVIGTAWIFEFFALINAPMIYTAMLSDFFLFHRFALFFAIFAFAVSLAREIIKDAEDVKGDETQQYSTLPIRIGLKKTTYIIASISFASMLFLLWSQYQLYIRGFTEAALYYFAVQALLYYTVSSVFKATSKEDWHNAGSMAKYTMLAGIAGMELIMIGFK